MSAASSPATAPASAETRFDDWLSQSLSGQRR